VKKDTSISKNDFQHRRMGGKRASKKTAKRREGWQTRGGKLNERRAVKARFYREGTEVMRYCAGGVADQKQQQTKKSLTALTVGWGSEELRKKEKSDVSSF